MDAGRPSPQFYAPGPIVEAEITQPSHPIFYGYAAKDVPVRYANGPLLAIQGLDAERDRQTLMRFRGTDAAVLSGLMKGAAETRNRPAIADVPSGKGRVLMFATNPCFRYENLGEFNMLFNAVLHYNDVEVAAGAPRLFAGRSAGDRTPACGPGYFSRLLVTPGPLAAASSVFWASETFGKRELHVLHRVHHGRGDDEAREALVVGRHDDPRRVRRRRVLDHVLVGVHVLLPEAPLLGVGRRELPVLLFHLDAFEEAPLLLLLRDVEEELADRRSRCAPGTARTR